MVEPYYKDALVKIYHGDCRELLPTLPKVDLVLTDPPYGVGVKYSAFNDTKANLISLIQATFPLIRAAAKTVLITPGNENMWLYPEPDHVLSWTILGGSGLSNWGFTCWHAVLAYGPDPYLSASKGSQPDAWLHQESSKQNGHPCPKPIGIWRRILLRGSVSETDTVLDPFIGSGTTLRAAKELNRKAIGIEIEERYCEIAAKRCESIQAGLFDAPVVPVAREPQTGLFQE